MKRKRRYVAEELAAYEADNHCDWECECGKKATHCYDDEWFCKKCAELAIFGFAQNYADDDDLIYKNRFGGN